jgi:L-rhamnose mutarotase
MRRVGQVIDLRPDMIDAYERLHAAVWPGVLAAIHRANIRNYTIYRHGTRLYASFEYVGDDYAADMSKMAADPVVQEWWTHTEAMQQPLPDRKPGGWWTTIPEVFHTD